MPTESLVAYAVTVHQFDAPDVEPTLDSFDTAEPSDDGSDLLDSLQAIFDELKGDEQTFDDHDTTLELDRWQATQSERAIDGFVRQGAWGEREDIFDPATGDEFNRMRNHIGKTLFYFYLHLPKGQKTGLLLTQKTGNRGIKTLFWQAVVAQMFRERFGGSFRLDIDPAKPRDVYKAFEEGEGTLRGITLVRHKLPRRITAQQVVPEEWVDEGILEVRVHGKRGVKELPWVKNLVAMLKGEHDVDDAVRLRLSDLIDGGEDGEEPDYGYLTMDQLKLEIEVWGKETTVLVSNEAAQPSRFSYQINIEYDQEDEWALLSDLREEALRVEGLLKGHFGWG